MSDYRTPVSSEPSKPQESQGDGKEFHESEVMPPFTSYEKDKGKPYLVDHYELGSHWNDGDMYSNAYKDEVTSINTYLEHLINTGEISNSIESVKETLKGIEKMVGIKKDSRTAVKVGLIAAHVEFLMKADNIKKTAGKYGVE